MIKTAVSKTGTESETSRGQSLSTKQHSCAKTAIKVNNAESVCSHMQSVRDEMGIVAICTHRNLHYLL